MNGSRGAMLPIMAAIMVVFTIIIVGGAWLVFEGPQALAGPIAQRLPPSVGLALGDSLIYKHRFARKPCDSRAGQAAIATLLYRLHQHMEDRPKVEVVVINHSQAYAYPVPGDRIIVHSTLIEQARDADDVAAVLAHLVGHVQYRHALAGLVRQLGPEGVLLYLRDDHNGLRERMAEFIAHVAPTSFSIEEEELADSWARARLTEAGLNPHGFDDYMAHIRNKSRTSMGERRFLANHRRFGTPPEAPADSRPALNDLQWKQLKAICS
ncbi:MAG: M48 family metallopeptidase [Alphaproteobacteria bacterium]